MGGEEIVVLAKRRAHSHPHSFLADGEMEEPRHPTAGIKLPDALLEQPDAQHSRVHLEELVEAESGHGNWHARTIIFAPRL
jgi:hypothetical protein